MLHHPAFRTFTLSLIMAAGASCNDTTNPPADATVDGSDALADALADTSDGADASQTSLSDDQIVAVLMAVDTGEIGQGQLAQTQGSDPRVRDYGARMVSEHTAASSTLNDLRLRIGVTPAESALSRMLTDDANATRASLVPLTGAAFDRNYVNAQITQHSRVIDVIDSALAPNATNAELRDAITNSVRPMVAAHLQDARDLVASLPSS